MRIPKIYLETSVFNHYFDIDREAHTATVKLFGEISEGRYEAYTSFYVVEELSNAKEPKRSKMLDLINAYSIIVLEDDAEARRLATIYMNNGVIPVKYQYDGLHIAIATVNDLEYIFSLNFQHINKVKTKAMTAIINMKESYRPITIASPMEV